MSVASDLRGTNLVVFWQGVFMHVLLNPGREGGLCLPFVDGAHSLEFETVESVAGVNLAGFTAVVTEDAAVQGEGGVDVETSRVDLQGDEDASLEVEVEGLSDVAAVNDSAVDEIDGDDAEGGDVPRCSISLDEEQE